jgi:hypothetical protein
MGHASEPRSLRLREFGRRFQPPCAGSSDYAALTPRCSRTRTTAPTDGATAGRCPTSGNNSVTRRLNVALGYRVDESPGDLDSENRKGAVMRPAERAALQSAVLREQVRILYESPVVLLVSLTIAVLIAFSLRGFYSGWLGRVDWVDCRYFSAAL